MNNFSRIAMNLCAAGLIAAGAFGAYYTADKVIKDSAPKVFNQFTNLGGNYFEHENAYSILRTEYDKIAVHSFCASACTILFTHWDRADICYNPAALFGFHEASLFGQMHKEFTVFAFKRYPMWLIKVFIEDGYDWYQPATGELGMMWYTGEELGLTPCRA